ncbi:MAG TPA: caspase family protein [Pyrinomonadaceae bacterium]|jgi:cytochrome c-type biogenesis protein CcmH/NrfG|nr:caspase family protein [Pyrinomonadaceae bacterium]
MKCLTILLAVLLVCNSLLAQKSGRRIAAPQNKEAEALIEAGDKLADDRKWSEAIAAYQQAIRVDPKNADARVGLGDAYMGAGKWTEALVVYKKAVELAPQSADAQYALGDAYNTMRMHGDAFAPLVKAIQLDPNFAEAYYGIGYAYLDGRQYAKSISFFNSAIRLKPDYEDAHYGLAVAYLNLGNQKGLEDERKKLVSLNSALVKNLDSDIDSFKSLTGEAVASSAPTRSSADAPPVLEQTKQRTTAPAAATPTPELTKRTAQSTATAPPASELTMARNQSTTEAAPESKLTEHKTSSPPAVAEGTELVKKRTQSTASSAQQTVAANVQDGSGSRKLQTDASQTRSSYGRRLALVIGNGDYNTAPPLKNPPNDARDIAARLKALGFEVTTGINLKQREMKRLIRAFGLTLKAGGAGLFYYAGHGVQSKGRNYLIPIDADIQSEVEVEDFGVDVNLVLNFMDEAQNGLNIVILDACRDNPFGRSFRSASNGLAQVDAPTGTLIAYATAPGRVASDGSGQNGLYTSELLRQMSVVGLSATEMFMRVRAEVMKQTGNKQVPWEASSLVGAFYFVAPSTSSANAAPTSSPANEMKVDPAAFELSYWDSIKNSTDPEEFNSYLERYPNGHFTVLAHNRMRQLEASLKKTANDKVGEGDAGRDTTTSPATQDPASDYISSGANKFIVTKSFDVRNGVKAIAGVLELSATGLRYREVGGRHDFVIPCNALQVVTINTSWASTVFHKLHIKYSFNGVENQIDLNGSNNKQMRDAILANCAMKPK